MRGFTGRVQAETGACSQTWGGLGWGGAGFSPQSPEVPIWWGLGGEKWRGAVFRMVLVLPFLFQTCLLWGTGGMEPSGGAGRTTSPLLCPGSGGPVLAWGRLLSAGLSSVAMPQARADLG